MLAVPHEGFGASLREVGSRPWSKPDFYFRAMHDKHETPAFKSQLPGPGAVMGPEYMPGSITGRVKVRRPPVLCTHTVVTYARIHTVVAYACTHTVVAGACDCVALLACAPTQTHPSLFLCLAVHVVAAVVSSGGGYRGWHGRCGDAGACGADTWTGAVQQRCVLLRVVCTVNL
jgi:hypothetical protein